MKIFSIALISVIFAQICMASSNLNSVTTLTIYSHVNVQIEVTPIAHDSFGKTNEIRTNLSIAGVFAKPQEKEAVENIPTVVFNQVFSLPAVAGQELAFNIVEKDFSLPSAGAPMTVLYFATGGNHDDAIINQNVIAPVNLVLGQAWVKSFTSKDGDKVVIKLIPQNGIVTSVTNLFSRLQSLKDSLVLIQSEINKAQNNSRFGSDWNSRLQQVKNETENEIKILSLILS